MTNNSRISEETRQKLMAAWPGVLSALAGGASVTSTLDAHGLTRTALAVALADPVLRADWEAAKEASAETFFDRLIDTTNNAGGDLDPARMRVVVDTLKWLAAKRNPKAYSDKSQLDVNVRTIDLTSIIRDANARLIASRQAPTIDLSSSEFKELL